MITGIFFYASLLCGTPPTFAGNYLIVIPFFLYNQWLYYSKLLYGLRKLQKGIFIEIFRGCCLFGSTSEIFSSCTPSFFCVFLNIHFLLAVVLFFLSRRESKHPDLFPNLFFFTAILLLLYVLLPPLIIDSFLHLQILNHIM